MLCDRDAHAVALSLTQSPRKVVCLSPLSTSIWHMLMGMNGAPGPPAREPCGAECRRVVTIPRRLDSQYFHLGHSSFHSASKFTYGYATVRLSFLLSHLPQACTLSIAFLLKLRPAWHKHATPHSRLSVVLA